MKSALIVLSFAIALSSCELLRKDSRQTSEDPEVQLEWAIDEYNSGRTDNAKESLESVIDTTQGPDRAETRAVAHFYLAAVAWDLGESGEADRQMRRCLSLRPNYRPDWKYFAPSLRKRYEDLQ